MSAFRVQATIALVATLVLLWLVALLEIDRAEVAHERVAVASCRAEAQAFARNTRSTIERVDELLLDLRGNWVEHADRFSDLIRQREPHIADIALQVSIVDAAGNLAFSNLDRSSQRIWLGDRKHVQIHLANPGSDRLFISKPILGKVSGRWSIQFSRPLLDHGQTVGVVVLSVEPEVLARYDSDAVNDASRSIAMRDGTLLARSPAIAHAESRMLNGFPYGVEQIPPTGFFRRSSQIDGVERLYGYQLMPEYGLIVATSHPASELNLLVNQERRLILTIVTGASAMIIGLFALLLRGDRQRVQAMDAMRSTEAMLQSSIDAIGEAFAIYDRQDRLAYFNQRYQAIYGLSGTAIERGRTFEDIMRAAVRQGQYPDAVGREDAWIAEHVANHQSARNDQIKRLADGTWLRIRERRTPEGHIVGFRIDITELVEARQAAEEAREAAEDANRLKTEFLANMSHELRTPLTGIVGMSDVLSRTTLDEHQREVLGYLNNCSERLRGLVADLLDYAALESGTLSIEGHEFSPRALIEEAARDAAAAARTKGLALAVEPGPEVPEVVCGDPYRLRQVLRQLIDNAVKFTNSGGVTLSTFCTQINAPGKLRLGFAIRDTGIGIADEDRELIFLPFTQKDGSASRLRGGTGLGLSLASGIVAQMGGTLGVDSVPGYGSEFRFTVEVTVP